MQLLPLNSGLTLEVKMLLLFFGGSRWWWRLSNAFQPPRKNFEGGFAKKLFVLCCSHITLMMQVYFSTQTKKCMKNVVSGLPPNPRAESNAGDPDVPSSSQSGKMRILFNGMCRTVQVILL